MRLVEATFSDVAALTEALTGADVAYLSSMSDAADTVLNGERRIGQQRQ